MTQQEIEDRAAAIAAERERLAGIATVMSAHFDPAEHLEWNIGFRAAAKQLAEEIRKGAK